MRGVLLEAASCVAIPLFIVLGAALRRLPPGAWSGLARWSSLVLWLILVKHRRRTIENLTQITGRSVTEARALGRACFHSNLLVFFEVLCLPRLRARRGVRVDVRVSPAAEAVVKRLRTGEIEMALAVSGHSGVWEFVGAELASMAAPTPTIVSARLPRPRILAAWLRRLRAAAGLILVEKADFLRRLVREVRARRPALYVVLADQHFRGGVRAPFLGRPACTVPVPAALIAKYGFPVLVGGGIRRAPGDFLIEIDTLEPASYRGLEAADAVQRITSDLNTILASYIERAPAQWTWGHRRWRTCCADPAEANVVAPPAHAPTSR